MDRRKFVFWFTGAVSDGATPPPPTSDPQRPTVIANDCGICGGAAVFDLGLDINVCLVCGAHETTRGWQKR